jgi:hypothetical protein
VAQAINHARPMREKTIKLGFDGVGVAGEKSFEYAQTIIHPGPGAQEMEKQHFSNKCGKIH